MVATRELTRRDFLRLSAGSVAALGMSLLDMPGFTKLLEAAVEEIPVLWLQLASCTGCSVSALNSLSPSIRNVLVNEVVPGKHVSLRYHTTVMGGAGDQAMKVIEDTARNKKGYVLVVEGAIPLKEDGVHCQIGERGGKGISALEHTSRLGSDAMAVLALGTCAAYGGIPSASPNPTGSVGVGEVFDRHGIKTPVINIPGCPSHPDWFIGTIASVLISGLGSVKLDHIGRPVAFFGQNIHENCPRRGHFDAGRFAKGISEPYCLYELGCKGPVTNSDCPSRRWNASTNWCIGAGAPCIGCTEQGFPDAMSPLYNKVSNVSLPGINLTADRVGAALGVATTVGLGAHLIGNVATGRFGRKKGELNGDHNGESKQEGEE